MAESRLASHLKIWPQHRRHLARTGQLTLDICDTPPPQAHKLELEKLRKKLDLQREEYLKQRRIKKKAGSVANVKGKVLADIAQAGLDRAQANLKQAKSMAAAAEKAAAGAGAAAGAQPEAKAAGAAAEDKDAEKEKAAVEAQGAQHLPARIIAAAVCLALSSAAPSHCFLRHGGRKRIAT